MNSLSQAARKMMPLLEWASRRLLGVNGLDYLGGLFSSRASREDGGYDSR